MERLAAGGELGQADLRRVYAGAYLSFYTYTERSIERLFLGLLMERFDLVGVRPLVDVRSELVARAIVVGGRSYADWLPLERHTVPRAQAFLSQGKPFSEVPRADIRTLDRVSIVRNALAHESSHALRQFRKAFTRDRPIPPDQRSPAGYLRGQHALGTTRLSNFFAETVDVFRRLCG